MTHEGINLGDSVNEPTEVAAISGYRLGPPGVGLVEIKQG